MKRYSIKELEKFSGIKAHTIRIWEQRYQLLTPERTDTNIRYYSEGQLKYLLECIFTIENGFRISQICNFTREEFNEQLKQIIEQEANNKEDSQINVTINELVLAMLDLDEKRFDKIISSNLCKEISKEYSLKWFFHS